MLKPTQQKQNDQQVVRAIKDKKIFQELMSRTYNRAYVFIGYYKREAIVDGVPIIYRHSECFFANDKYPDETTKFIRLTGDGVNGEILVAADVKSYDIGDCFGKELFVEDNGLQYIINSNCNIYNSWLDNNTLSGYKIKEYNDQLNDIYINIALKRTLEQRTIDDNFDLFME